MNDFPNLKLMIDEVYVDLKSRNINKVHLYTSHELDYLDPDALILDAYIEFKKPVQCVKFKYPNYHHIASIFNINQYGDEKLSESRKFLLNYWNTS